MHPDSLQHARLTCLQPASQQRRRQTLRGAWSELFHGAGPPAMRAEPLQRRDQSKARVAEAGARGGALGRPPGRLSLGQRGGAPGAGGRGEPRNGVSAGHSPAGGRGLPLKTGSVVQWAGPRGEGPRGVRLWCVLGFGLLVRRPCTGGQWVSVSSLSSFQG